VRRLIIFLSLICLACVGCGTRPAPDRQPDIAPQEAERRNAQERFLAFVKAARKAGIGYDLPTRLAAL
jgi:hypothetical protein